MNNHTLQSIGAFFAGLLATVILSIGTDLLLHATDVFPPVGQPMSDNLFVLATLYRTVYSIFGAYLTARIAPAHPMKHALILGAVGTVIATIGLVATWNKGPEFGPKWYPVALVLLSVPQCWLGGKLRVLQLAAPVTTESEN
jgi:surface polysaccharide O-acyltransferase-like enzyme